MNGCHSEASEQATRGFESVGAYLLLILEESSTERYPHLRCFTLHVSLEVPGGETNSTLLYIVWESSFPGLPSHKPTHPAQPALPLFPSS